MRTETDEKLWVVTDLTAESVLIDICFEASLHSLERQFRGGLTCDENPTLFTDADEAKAEAQVRLQARDAAVEVVRGVEDLSSLGDIDRIQIVDADGNVLFSEEIGRLR